MRHDSGDKSDPRSAALLQKLIANNLKREERPLREQPAPHLALERRSLLALFAAGELAGVDAAAIGTLSDLLFQQPSGLRGRLRLAELDHELPIFSAVRTLPAGRIASFVIPKFYTQVYADRESIVRLLDRSLHMAHFLGARSVSLTGLLASASDYGQACSDETGLPMVTTGHATTASAVVLTIRDLLRATGRDLSREALALIGVGSVGATTLRLLFAVLGRPRSVALCDIFQKRESVTALMADLRHDYPGPLTFHQSRGPVPDDVYDSTLVVGATNMPAVLDVRRLRPGTLLVDDSDPHCFDPSHAFLRLNEAGDILFTEAGVLRSPDPVDQLLYVPDELAEVVPLPTHPESAWNITGCVISGLLSSTLGFPHTRGAVRLDDAVTHFHGLVKLGFTAASPHCAGNQLDSALVASFGARFGNTETR